MNGRIFDPGLARFLSADPIVQDAGYSQTYNRYSYCINNPLGYTDPSGYSFWDRVKDAFKLNIFLPGVVLDPLYWFAPQFHAQYAGQALGIAASAVVMYYTGDPALAGAAGGFASGFANSLLNGGSVGDAFKAGAIGAAIGYAMGGITSAIGGYYGDGWQGWTTEIARAATHGAVGGIYAEATGGDFLTGFAGSFVGSFAGHASNNFIKGDTWGAIAGRTTVAAVAGGTTSVIGGGKFANGAFTAAFQHLLNNERTLIMSKATNNAGQSGNTEQPSAWSVGWTGAKQGLWAALDGANPFGNPLANRGLYDPKDPDLKISKGIGTYVVAPAATIATGAAIWSAAGGSTATVYVGSGTPFHVALEAGGTTVHSLGRIGAQVFTTKGAEAFAATSWGSVTGIPILSSAAATTTGYATTTCVGGVCTALARGWGWPWF
jgi:hypothetical protein